VIGCRESVGNRESGFTLVELAVIIVVIGVLASFGVPRFRAAVEKSRAGEAVSYLAAIRGSQERYQGIYGTYASSLDSLDVRQPTPKYFDVGTLEPGATGDLEDSWTLTLTRSSPSAGYGNYTVVFGQDGFDPVESTILDFPEISPIAVD
jgi:type II secretory pathway pseudopilin PulG